MKKFLALLMALVLVFGLAACGNKADGKKEEKGADEAQTEVLKALENEVPEVIKDPEVIKTVDYSKVKIGFIFLHDPNASTYDNNFYQAAQNAVKALGLKDDQVIYKWNIPEEGSDCLDTASQMVDEGCNIVFADSFGHESNMKLAAEQFPDVQFCHATGTQGIVAGLANYHNAFASIYDGRYLAGIAAGMKLNEMIKDGKITADQAKIGYVGAWPYAEVKSGYTSFYLGAKSVCETATMEVTYTNSWFDIGLEKEGALSLIKDGCVLISQHADSEGAPKACEENNVPNIAYNISTADIAPNTAIISSKINWEPYFKLIINAVATGAEIPNDWCGSIATGSVELTELNEKAAAPGTAEAIEAAKAKIIAGELHVYDVNNFTVTVTADKNTNATVDENGHLTSYIADVKDMGDFTGETEVVKDGVFNESTYRSAPYFDFIIDGITEK